LTIAVVKAANAAGRHSHLRIFVPEMDYSTQHVISRYTQRGTNNINTDDDDDVDDVDNDGGSSRGGIGISCKTYNEVFSAC
jgi:hypothetical protein